MTTRVRFAIEPQRASSRWNSRTRDLNEPVVRRYMAAQELARNRG